MMRKPSGVSAAAATAVSRFDVVSALKWIANADSSISAVLQNLLTQVGMIFISFGTGIIIARQLGAAGRGEVAALILWPMIFSGLFAFGIPAALVHYGRRYPADQASLFCAAMTISAVASALMIVAGSIIIPKSLHEYSPRTIHWAVMLMLLAPQLLLGYSVTGFFQVRGKFAFFNQTRYVPAATTLAALSILWSLHKLTPESAALAYLLPPVPMFALALYRVSRMIDVRFADLGTSIKRLLNYGSRAAGIDLLGTLSSQVDQFLIVGFLSPATMGTYVVALSVSRILNVVFSATTMVLSPQLVGRSPEDMTEFLGRSIRLSLFVAVVAALCLAAAVPLALPRLYGRDFSASVPIVFVFLGDVLLGGITSAIAEAFKAKGRPGLVTIIEAGTLASTVILMVAMIPRFGAIGAALALVTASALRLAAVVTLYGNVVGTSPPGMLIRRSDVSYTARRLREQFDKGTT